MMNIKTEQKKLRLEELTVQRKKCKACKCDSSNAKVELFNAAAQQELDTNTIGQWTTWNGNVDAKYMIVGQDWGTKEYLKKFRDIQKTVNYPCELYSITNQNLAKCVMQLNQDWDILELDGIHDNMRYPLYFTNEILCYKDDKRMNAVIPSGFYKKCASLFLLEQINIVEPECVVLLGASTFKGFVAAAKDSGLNCPVSINGAFADLIARVLEERIGINYLTPNGKNVKVFPMWHPGGLGLRNAKVAYISKYGNSDITALDVVIKQWEQLGKITK